LESSEVHLSWEIDSIYKSQEKVWFGLMNVVCYMSDGTSEETIKKKSMFLNSLFFVCLFAFFLINFVVKNN
jgi:hypothetical protein